CGAAVQDAAVGTVEELHGGDLEVFGGGVQHGEVNVRAEKTHDAVGLHDYVFRAGDFALDVRDGLMEAALAGAHPDGTVSAGDEKARSIGLTGAVALITNGAEVVVTGIAVAGLAVCRADAVAELRDLERGPVVLGQSGDQACHHAGFAHAAGVSADDDKGHTRLLWQVWREKSADLAIGYWLLADSSHLAATGEGIRFNSSSELP